MNIIDKVIQRYAARSKRELEWIYDEATDTYVKEEKKPRVMKPELMPGFKYEFKSSSQVSNLAMFHKSKRVGHVNAIWWSHAGSCSGNESEIRQQYPQLTKSPVLIVHNAWIDVPELRGQGLGKAMYQTFIMEVYKKFGPFIFTNDACHVVGSTSSDAMRVWNSLKKQYPHSGDVLAILKPHTIGDDISKIAFNLYDSLDIKDVKVKFNVYNEIHSTEITVLLHHSKETLTKEQIEDWILLSSNWRQVIQKLPHYKIPPDADEGDFEADEDGYRGYGGSYDRPQVGLSWVDPKDLRPIDIVERNLQGRVKIQSVGKDWQVVVSGEYD